MSNVKVHRLTFIDLQLEIEKILESLRLMAITVEQVMDNNLNHLQNIHNQAIDDLNIAERNYYSSYRYNESESKDQDYDEAQTRYYASQRKVDNANLKLTEFRREMDEYREVAARLAWQLIDYELPKCKSELAHREQIVERLTRLGILDDRIENAGRSSEIYTRRAPILKKVDKVDKVDNEDKWIKRGIISVSVEDLPNPEGIYGEADFQKVSSEEMQKGLLRLQEIEATMKTTPDINGDYWTEVDNLKGLEYSKGYRQVYDAFWGDGAIKLTKVGNTYHITNGRHRIWLAKRMGLKTLPAKVTEKND